MTADSPRIESGSRVRLHLEIRLADGTPALSTFGEDPLELTLGDGTLVTALEGQLIGLSAGSEEQILTDGSQLYGPRDEARIHWLARSDFPADLDLTPGQVIAFEAPGGQETAGVLLETDGDRVQVDFNHPLAGRSLQIRIQVLSVLSQGGPAAVPGQD
jgi:FKBP-type peptidyl-prolyl cis-trans isomerase SlpA